MSLKHADTTSLILKAFFQVYNELGYGFLEKIYAHSLRIAGREVGLRLDPEVPIRVHYRGHVVGEYFADLVADGCVVVELKATRRLCPEHEAQLLNYLKASRYEVGMLLNFGTKPEFRRRVFDNERKGTLSWHKEEPDADER